MKSTHSGENDINGYCKNARIEDLRKTNYLLTPGRYIGSKEVEDDGIAFDNKMISLTLLLNNKWKRQASWR